MKVAVVIPCLNEAGNIGIVVAGLIEAGADTVVVVDNASTDATAEVGRAAGAIVVDEPRRGYGWACAAGTTTALNDAADVIVYIDGDQSSLASELDRLVDPIRDGAADLVLGSRTLGTVAAGAMPPHQKFGNWLTAAVMRRLYGIAVTDLGPYRAITADLIQTLGMTEMTFGWPTEMMVKAANRQARIVEVPATWERRGEGDSKVSGTIKGSALAAWHILRVTFRHRPGARRRGDRSA